MKNLSVTDTKPQNELVLDTKPNNQAVVDSKPSMLLVDTEQEIYRSVVLGAGMYMGIPPHTYPVAITVSNSFNP